MKTITSLAILALAVVSSAQVASYEQTTTATTTSASLNTGVFAPGQHYSFLGVATYASGTGADWSACVSTTLGAYHLTNESYLSFDALAGFSFTHSAADAGLALCYNFGCVKLSSLLFNIPSLSKIMLSGQVGAVALTEKGQKVGYGIVLGGGIKF